MDTGIYVALSKEVGIFRDMEVTANNIANATTTAYQSEDLLFTDYLVANTKAEPQVAFTDDVATVRNTEQGAMQITGNSLDAAIEGHGYFVVQTPLGTRYTRNGNFKTNQDGVLVTSEGYPVMDDGNQPITFDNTDKVISIRDDGTVNVDNTDRARINIVQFTNEQMMEKAGNTYYKSTLPPQPAADYRVLGGVLERSNVNPVASLTHMLYVARSASDTANFINTMFTLERKASDTLAKIYS